jgi:NtrC-family two-component system sensor histidine kinase KinB
MFFANALAMTLYLRHKFLLGFGGLLAITILVTTIGASVIGAYSRVLQKMLTENYNSIVFSENMKAALLQIESNLQLALAGNAAFRVDSVFHAVSQFDENLTREQGNITLSREPETVNELSRLWSQYTQKYPVILDSNRPISERTTLFWNDLIPLGTKIRGMAQKISDMNLANMSAVDGQAHHKAEEATFVITLLVVIGATLAVALIAVTGTSILRPLRVLTESVREIQKGNLNIMLQSRTKDEVGQLVDAFNDMASQLREYHRTEHARLIRTEHSTQSVIDSLSDAIAILNVKGDIELSNKSAQELFGLYPEVNLPGRKDDLLREMFYSALLLEQPSDRFDVNNTLQVFKDGQERFYLPHAIPIFGEAQNIIGVTLVLEDVTRMRRVTELEIEPIAVVSHELKTPLTSMRMAIHMLSDPRIGALNSKQAELLDAARQDSEQLSGIMESLLDISKMEAGKSKPAMAPCSPEQLITQALDAFVTPFRNAGVELVTHIGEEVPNVVADPERVSHVFSNLLSNALKYSVSGNTVKLSAESDGDWVRFSVQDQGPGIPSENLTHIFERFFRGSGVEKNKGVGLGLAIAKEIVEVHGGRIWVESAPGQGSTFHFTLRSIAPDETQASAETAK